MSHQRPHQRGVFDKHVETYLLDRFICKEVCSFMGYPEDYM